MNIVYFANFTNEGSDKTEEHIINSLESLGHKVFKYDEKDFVSPKIAQFTKEVNADVFLFHKGGETNNVILPRFIELLNRITCKKVCWYFDKISFADREMWMETVIPYTDHVFVTDETWAKRHKYNNVHVLRQGIGKAAEFIGIEWENDIVFLGNAYGERQAFVDGLKEVYGDKFKVINDKFNDDLIDLCRKTKIFVAPQYPQDNWYWSSRVYMILGSGGFLIHPKFEGLKEEFSDEELVTYRNGTELRDKINYYLTHDDERVQIQGKGWEKVKNEYTYTKRVEQLINKLNEKVC